MPIVSATAVACPNIAFIKYWGDITPSLHIPVNGSISMNLAELSTRTSVSFDPSLSQDEFKLNGEPTFGNTFARVSIFLNRVRQLANISTFARVDSHNNFPMAAGIASSASGFAALSMAASRAAGILLNEKDLSRLARTGSGSACRSIPSGFVEWQAGHEDVDSYAYCIASPQHWDLVDCITLVSQVEKQVPSSVGHMLASTSPLQPARVADTPRRLSLCRDAILENDFDQFAEVVELDSNLMHAVMITSTPPLIYWQPATITAMHAVQSWRKAGIPVCYTIDAGPNIHVLCLSEKMDWIVERLLQLPGVIQVLPAHPGGPASLEHAPNNAKKGF